MKIKQTNEKNIGLPSVDYVINGYQHHDALWFSEDKHITYRPLAVEIYEKIIKPKNLKKVLELGSGAGSLAAHLRELSNNELTVVTLDANMESVNSPYIEKNHHFIIRTDEPYNLVNENGERITFDLVLSFEHFEHISPGELFSIFLDNIKNHITKETTILATASLQKGGDHWHPNVKSYDEWKTYLEEQGFYVMNSNFVRNDTVPFNFPVHLTNELYFQLK